MPKLRVTHITPLVFGDESRIGGGERYVSVACHAINRHLGDRISASIVSFSATHAGSREYDGLRITVLRNESMSKDPMDAMSRELFHAIASADIVHLHQPLTRCGEMALIAARYLNKVVVATDHGHVSSDLLFEWKGINLVDAYICVSEFSARCFRPLTACPVHVVRGPVDTNFFKPAPTESPKKQFVLCVSRLLPHKGIDRVIQALPDGLELVVCGKPYDTRYEALLKSQAKRKSVRFVAHAGDSELLRLYQSAKVTVLASTYRDCFGNLMARPELMGFVLLESMACGTPVICSRVGGMPELVREGVTGKVFDNDEQLRAYLCEVKLGTWPEEASSEACIEHVLSRFSSEMVAFRLGDIYKQALDRSLRVDNSP